MKAMISNIIFFAVVYVFLWKRKRNKLEAAGKFPFATDETKPDAVSTIAAFSAFIALAFASFLVPFAIVPMGDPSRFFILPALCLALLVASYKVSVRIPKIPMLSKMFPDSKAEEG